MNKRLKNILAGTVMVLSASTTSAAVIDMGTLSLDVTRGTFVDVVDYYGESGVYWYSDIVAFEPITVNEGDILNVDFEFLAGQSLELINGTYNLGREIAQYRQGTPPIANRNTSTASFTGVEGDLNSPGIFTSTSLGSFFNGTVNDNMTDTSFAFHDIHFQTDYFSLPDGAAEVSFFQLVVAANDINTYVSVPEPASLALLAIGLAGFGFVGKRNRG